MCGVTRAPVTCTCMNSDMKFPVLEKIKVSLESQSTFLLLLVTFVKSDCMIVFEVEIPQSG